MPTDLSLRTIAPFVGMGQNPVYYMKPTDGIVVAYQPREAQGNLVIYAPPAASVEPGWSCLIVVLPTFKLVGGQPVICTTTTTIKNVDTDLEIGAAFQRGTMLLFRNAQAFGYFVDFRSFENCPGSAPQI